LYSAASPDAYVFYNDETPDDMQAASHAHMKVRFAVSAFVETDPNRFFQKFVRFFVLDLSLFRAFLQLMVVKASG
jgi:hypothetical protein